MLVLFLMSNESSKKYRWCSDMMLRVAEMQMTYLIWLTYNATRQRYITGFKSASDHHFCICIKEEI